MRAEFPALSSLSQVYMDVRSNRLNIYIDLKSSEMLYPLSFIQSSTSHVSSLQVQTLGTYLAYHAISLSNNSPYLSHPPLQYRRRQKSTSMLLRRPLLARRRYMANLQRLHRRSLDSIHSPGGCLSH